MMGFALRCLANLAASASHSGVSERGFSGPTKKDTKCAEDYQIDRNSYFQHKVRCLLSIIIERASALLFDQNSSTIVH